MIELKRCPLCGAEGKLKDTHGKIRQGWVGCPACGLYIGWKILPDGAVVKWNRRAGDFTADLTEDALLLLQIMPAAVNELAARLINKLEISDADGRTTDGD